MKKFLHTLPTKLWLLLFALLFFTFFTNDFGLVDIQKTAIILAAGVDRTEEGVALTAQIAVPKGTDRTTGGTSSVEITGQGSTVTDCLADIYARTGWVPKLVFCDLIVLGEEAATGDVFDCLDDFLRNEYIPDSCKLAVCEGKAEELLSSTSAIDDTSALALGKLFSDAAEKSGQVMTTTLREFAMGYFGESESGYMPYVRAQKQEGSEQGTGGAQSGGQSSQGGRPEEKVYSAGETALFSRGEMVGLLSERETFAFSLLEGKVYAGSFPWKGGTYTVLKDDGGVSLETTPTPGLKLSLSLKVRRTGENAVKSPADLVRGVLTPEEERALSRELEGALRSLWERCAGAECDLLLVRRDLMRASRTQYFAWKDVPLSSFPVYIDSRVESIR